MCNCCGQVLAYWAYGYYATPDFEDGTPILKVTTIHGETAIVRLGDWIIKERKIGFYYPIKDDIFRDGYV